MRWLIICPFAMKCSLVASDIMAILDVFPPSHFIIAFGVFHDGVYLAMLSSTYTTIHFAIHNNLITLIRTSLVHGILVYSATTLRQAAGRSFKQGIIRQYCTP